MNIADKTLLILKMIEQDLQLLKEINEKHNITHRIEFQDVSASLRELNSVLRETIIKKLREV